MVMAGVTRMGNRLMDSAHPPKIDHLQDVDKTCNALPHLATVL